MRPAAAGAFFWVVLAEAAGLRRLLDLSIVLP